MFSGFGFYNSRNFRRQTAYVDFTCTLHCFFWKHFAVGNFRCVVRCADGYFIWRQYRLFCLCTYDCLLCGKLCIQQIFVPSFVTVIVFSLAAVMTVMLIYYLLFVLIAGLDSGCVLFVRHYISRILYTFAVTIPLYFLTAFLNKIFNLCEREVRYEIRQKQKNGKKVKRAEQQSA